VSEEIIISEKTLQRKTFLILQKRFLEKILSRNEVGETAAAKASGPAEGPRPPPSAEAEGRGPEQGCGHAACAVPASRKHTCGTFHGFVA
jgi:hypothetical protein